MEHRWSARKLFERKVRIEGLRIGSTAVMRDVSLGGLQIEIGLGLLPLNAPVHVAFNLASPEQQEQHNDFRLEAMVVRHTPAGGAGLMFLQLDTDTIRSLRIALYGGSAPNKKVRWFEESVVI